MSAVQPVDVTMCMITGDFAMRDGVCKIVRVQDVDQVYREEPFMIYSSDISLPGRAQPTPHKLPVEVRVSVRKFFDKPLNVKIGRAHV